MKIRETSPHIIRIKEALKAGDVDPAKLIIINDFSRYKSYSKILYALLLIKFSSYWELHNILNIPCMTQVRRCIDKYVRSGIVTTLKKNNTNYRIASNFWKKQYPTSPYAPIYFTINTGWIDAIRSLETHLSRFFEDVDIAKISNRAKSYVKYRDTVEQQIKQRTNIINKSKGVCAVCDIIIRNEFEERKEYYKYGEKYICKNCNTKASDETKVKWIKEC